MARAYKSLKVEKGYAHREHRSRRSIQGLNDPKKKSARLAYKRKLEAIRVRELERFGF